MEFKKFTQSLILLLSAQSLAAQTTWSEHVAPIVFKHCTSCHRSGEIAPFQLTNYQEATAWGNMMQYVTEIRYMPPWKPDMGFGAEYKNANFLTDDQINTIKSWVDGGMQQGDPSLEPPLPVFPTGSQVGTPDLVLSFPQQHTLNDNNEDEYRYFVLPTGLTENKDLVALEVRPGNTKVVHHTLVWADTSGTAAMLDAQTPEFGYIGGQSNGGGQSSFGDQLPTYVPGARPNVYNNGMAQRIFAGSDLVLQMHYAPVTSTETDSSTVNLFFADQPASRFVNSYIMLPFDLENGPFIIFANQIKEFHGTLNVPFDVSIIGTMPHSHLLGKNWRVFAVTPSNDTIPLIHIPDWDFNWQGTYYFKKPQVLPKNSIIHAFATYDNTSGNPNNPNNPPAFVTWGEGTTDEMYYLPLLWLPYQSGDENLNLEEVNTSTNNGVFHFSKTKLYPVSPNPVTNDDVKIGFTLEQAMPVSLRVYDLSGRLIHSLLNWKSANAGEHVVHWSTSDLQNGVYCVVLEANGILQTQRVVVLR